MRQSNHDYLRIAYDLNLKSYVIIGLIENVDNVVIPTNFNDGVNGTKPISEIYFGALANTPIKTLTVSSGVTTIGPFACDNCQELKEVKIKEGLRHIATGAFRNCISLEAINYPDSLKSVADKAFSGCINLPREHRVAPSEMLLAKQLKKN